MYYIIDISASLLYVLSMDQLCTECNIPKPLSAFYARHKQCKDCIKKSRKIYYQTNKEKIIERVTERNLDPIIKAKIKNYRKEYWQRKEVKRKDKQRRIKEREKRRIRAIKYYYSDKGIETRLRYWANPEVKERQKEKKARYRATDSYKEVQKERMIKWLKNPDVKLKRHLYIKKYSKDPVNIKRKRAYYNYKYKTDDKYRLNRLMKRGILYSLRDVKNGKNGRKWESLVGYSVYDLKKRLIKTLPTGYKWSDFMTGKLEIDHVIPLSVYNFEDAEHFGFKCAWALSNLQLLPMKENRSKSNKIDKPFQQIFLF